MRHSFLTKLALAAGMLVTSGMNANAEEFAARVFGFEEVGALNSEPGPSGGLKPPTDKTRPCDVMH